MYWTNLHINYWKKKKKNGRLSREFMYVYKNKYPGLDYKTNIIL